MKLLNKPLPKVKAIFSYNFLKVIRNSKLKITAIILGIFILISLAGLGYSETSSNQILNKISSSIFQALVTVSIFFVPFILADKIISEEINKGYYKTIFVKPISVLNYYSIKLLTILVFALGIDLTLVILKFLVLKTDKILTFSFLASLIHYTLFVLLVTSVSFFFSSIRVRNTLVSLLYFVVSYIFDTASLSTSSSFSEVGKFISTVKSVGDIILLPISQLDKLLKMTEPSALLSNLFQVFIYAGIFISLGLLITLQVEMPLKEK